MAVSGKSKGGSKLTRSEVVTVRFDPKLRFALELGARKQRRTVSSFIEWAVEEALEKVTVEDEMAKFPQINIHELMGFVWDVDPADRFVKLATTFPDLMTYDEERVWKSIQESKDYFYFKNGSPNFGLIRENWEALHKNEWSRPEEEF